ncbi:MAG: tetratricopeptide repeat protein [Sandaracinus sp.]
MRRARTTALRGSKALGQLALACAVAGAMGAGAMGGAIARAQDADAGLPWSGVDDAGGADAGAGDAATTADAEPPAPWSQATDVPLPAFLDTTDRRIHDDRPPPTAEQVAALEEMEAEAGRFTKAGSSYRGAIDSILRREYQRQRREREQGYARQIREEERLQTEARNDAITRFERFVRTYPNDPTYTPDAMFRLGELYYERDAIAFQDAQEDVAAATGHPDFSATIGMYRDLVARFPGYRRADGVYYLIGYCLGEMGELEEAVSAWLNLVCANHFTYTGPPAPPTDTEEPAEDTSLAATHASGSLDVGTAAAPPPDVYIDPYVDCTPVQPDAEFVSETWLRIGEYHFDYDPQPHFLERAISAYNHVLADPNDHNYNLALYKVAWAYYRASRYPEAIQHFAMLIDWSDNERERTGRAGSELRAEAVQYLGITFAYDDWNEDSMPDTTTGLQRIQDPSLLPQDRPWTAEVYFQLGQTYFDEAQYELAIQVWQLALQRWPLHFRAGEIRMQVARAYGRLNDRARQTQTEDEIAAMGQGSDWWEANPEHDRERQAVEERAQTALINQALRIHQQATHDRQEAVREHDAALLQQAIQEYNDAATAYRTFIERYPNSPDSYTLEYNLADALFWSEQYEEAAQAYAAVRDSNLDDQYLSESARRVVESLKRLLDAAVARHEVEVRTEAPEPVDGRVQPIEMPQLVQRVAQAREVYLARVDEAHDSEHVRGDYQYNNTLLLYYYGYWDQARERFRQLYLDHCNGPSGSEVGQVAWQNLYNMAVAANDTAEVSRLSHDVLDRNCTFTPDGSAPVAHADCECGAPNQPPQCIAQCGLTDAEFVDAERIYTQARGATPDDQLCPSTVSADQVRLYEQSATMFVTAVNAHPNHDHAPDALVRAAIALECTSRYESASHLYERVIDEVGPRQASDSVPQQQLDSILATAYFRLAYTANRFFDYDRAVQNYRTLADSQRFQRSTDPQMPGRRTDALINAARILEFQQDYTHATEYYRRVTDALASATDADSVSTRRTAFYRIAEMSYSRHDWNGTIRDMQAFIDRYRSDSGAGELVVQATWRIAQARQQQHASQSQITAALQAVVDAYARSGQTPGSIAAEYAAQAKFQIVDPQGQAFESFTIDTRRGRTTETYIQGIVSQIQAGSHRAQEAADAYAPVLTYNRPTWTVAALVRQGRVYEVLAHAIVAAQHPLPEDLQHQFSRASPDVQAELQTQFDDRIRQAMEPQIAPVECFAVVRYALAARAARAGSLDTEFTRQAIDRLQAYGDDRIAQCIEQGRAQDQTLGAYTPGEFTRARAGRTESSMPPDLGPPPLAPASGDGP